MIKAQHNIIAETLYRIYADRLLRSGFEKFILVNKVPDLINCKGLILTPNHFSWWDGFFADYLIRKFIKRTRYIMMLEDQLKQYWFFKYTGAFSIKQNSLSSVKESINYAKDISSSPSNYLIFYPQGEINSYRYKNIKLKRGLALITEDANSSVLIVSFKIEYGNKRKPSVYCRFGDLLSSTEINADFDVYEKVFNENIKSLDTVKNQNGMDLFKK